MAIALAFVQSPFMHDHEHEENNGHSGPIFHTHFHHLEQPSNTHQLRNFDPDDDARDQDWFSVVLTHFEMSLAMPASVNLSYCTPTSEPFAEREIASGHDPPRLTQSSPRAPPV